MNRSLARLYRSMEIEAVFQMWTVLLLCLACSAWLATALAAEDLSVPPPMPAEAPSASSPPAKRQPAPKGSCPDCGVIRSIEQTEEERRGDEMPSYISSPQYLGQRDFSRPVVGPVLGITFGKGQTTQTFVGAAGSETMRRRIKQADLRSHGRLRRRPPRPDRAAGHRRLARRRPRACRRVAPGAAQGVAGNRLTGIGRATALAFARERARIVVSGRRDEIVY